MRDKIVAASATGPVTGLLSAAVESFFEAASVAEGEVSFFYVLLPAQLAKTTAIERTAIRFFIII